MKILHVGKYYPPSRGGMETVLETLVEGCLDRGCDVSVLVAAETAGRTVEPLGRNGHLVRMPRAALVNSQPVTATVLTELRRELDRFGPDLVHIHFPNPLGAVAWRLLGLTGTDLPPLFVWHHADITRQKVGRLLAAPVQKMCLLKAVGVSVSSPELAAQSSELRAVLDRVTVIPFGLSPEPWSDLAPDGTGPFLFVGRLVPYKGLDILLEALARTAGLRLDVAGQGPERSRLEAVAGRLGLTDRVRFHGEVSPDALHDLMGGAAALVLPSLDGSETFGLVQLEAMAAGLPVIASDLPTGVAGVGVDGETGRLVPPGDPQALAAALGDFAANPARVREMGARARARFQEGFTRDLMTDRLLDFYRAGLARH